MAGFSPRRGFLFPRSHPQWWLMRWCVGPFQSAYTWQTGPSPTGNSATVRAHTRHTLLMVRTTCSLCCMIVSSAFNVSDGWRGLTYLTLLNEVTWKRVRKKSIINSLLSFPLKRGGKINRAVLCFHHAGMEGLFFLDSVSFLIASDWCQIYRNPLILPDSYHVLVMFLNYCNT